MTLVSILKYEFKKAFAKQKPIQYFFFILFLYTHTRHLTYTQRQVSISDGTAVTQTNLTICVCTSAHQPATERVKWKFLPWATNNKKLINIQHPEHNSALALPLFASLIFSLILSLLCYLFFTPPPPPPPLLSLPSVDVILSQRMRQTIGWESSLCVCVHEWTMMTRIEHNEVQLLHCWDDSMEQATSLPPSLFLSAASSVCLSLCCKQM